MIENTVQLRRLQPEDAPQLAILANNKKIWDHLRDFLPHPYLETDAVEFINSTLREDPHQNFAITYKEELCGVIGIIAQEDVYKKSGEVGYWIGEPYWGKGIATEAVKKITQYGFEQLQLARVFAGIFSFNKASMRVLEKNGFQSEGIFRNAIFKNNQLWDEHRYAKVNEAH